MKNNPKYIWGNQINLSGLLSSKPLKYKYCKDARAWYLFEEKDDFFNNNFSIEQLGLDERVGYIRFSSVNKKDVEIWTQGILSFRSFLIDNMLKINLHYE